MHYRYRLSLIAAASLAANYFSFAAENSESSSIANPVPLCAAQGRSLKLYITKRVPFRSGEPVHARTIEPVWSFDRIVIPAGSTVEGRVLALQPVPGMVRLRAILAGDFTPLKRARVSFTELVLPDGRIFALNTSASTGLPTIYDPPRTTKPAKQAKAATTRSGSARQFAKTQIQNQLQTQANARTYGLFSFVRGPNKREWMEDFLLSKLPYHPQWYRSRTRFDATLSQPIAFGTAQVLSSELAGAGTRIPPDATGQMAIVNTVSSSNSRVGDRLDGVLSEPLFTPEHKLLFPQGTRFSGRITLAEPARLFHRGGKLRFAIEKVEPPENQLVPALTPVALTTNTSVHAELLGTEAGPTQVKVDTEGTASATESKTRLLRPVVAALVAAKSMDNDAGKQTATGGAASPNYGGQALGGFSGFGSLGSAVAAGPRSLGVAFGYYGLAWSIYSNVISRGRDVTFEKNSSVLIKFGLQH